MAKAKQPQNLDASKSKEKGIPAKIKSKTIKSIPQVLSAPGKEK